MDFSIEMYMNFPHNFFFLLATHIKYGKARKKIKVDVKAHKIPPCSEQS